MIRSSACPPWRADHPGLCRRARRPMPSATPPHGTRSTTRPGAIFRAARRVTTSVPRATSSTASPDFGCARAMRSAAHREVIAGTRLRSYNSAALPSSCQCSSPSAVTTLHGWMTAQHAGKCLKYRAGRRLAGPTTRRTYAGRIRELIAGYSTLEAIATALPKVRDALVHEFAGFERKLRAIARQDDNARRLMTTPGVGVLVALTFVAAVDAPERFRSSRAVGPHFGLTPKKYQSGETDHSGRISKIGDGSLRTGLYEAANVILTRPVKGSDLKGWALAVARRAGPRKARVALARKLAVVLHCMLRDRTNFVPRKVAPALTA
ncbi:transposon-related protein (plasmid) [Sinorhizobium fredii HH103]|nr:hypothetical protein SFHH103_04780 [Sinorhizobium fredii HH103]CEO91274.1 transposon-related protein [Sinorhizobium fredii HH103]